MKYQVGEEHFQVNETILKKIGDSCDEHDHNCGHMTYIPKGAARVFKDATFVDIRASDGKNWIYIEAKKKHRIIALEDNTYVHCIFANRTPDGEVVQYYTGWEKAYV